MEGKSSHASAPHNGIDGDGGVGARLRQLRSTLEENDSVMARKKRLDAESLLRAGLSMMEAARNAAHRQIALKNQREALAAGARHAEEDGASLLPEILAVTDSALAQNRTRLDASLAYYTGTLDEICALDGGIVTELLMRMDNELSGRTPRNETMRGNLAIFRDHVERWRKGAPPERAVLLSQLLKQPAH